MIPTAAGTWSNTVPGSNGGTSGGNLAGFNATTNTILFGYTQQTVAYNYVFSQALQNAGLAIGGYNYSWKINNNDVPTINNGTLVGKFTLKALNGTALQTYTYDYSNIKTVGDSENFQSFSGTQWFPQNYPSSQISAFSMEWTGKDSRFWAGYYGPRVRQPSIELRYLADLCASNPLSSPDCPGYAEAYKAQQCTANALYDPSCPGYAEAFKTQQCSINALYDPSCPGYATAYFNDQCIKDSLYDKKCEGYATAYAIKYIVPLDPAVTNAVNQQLTNIQETYKNDPARVTVVSPTVDTVLTTPSSTSVSPASVTSVLRPPPPPPGASPTAAATSAAGAPPPPPPPAKQEEKAQDQKKTDGEVKQAERKAGGNPQNARKEVAAKAAQIAKEAGKAATLEAQAAQQGLLVGLMGYVPGFTGYQQSNIPDTNGLELAKQYEKPVVDNRSAQRRLSGANELRWREMVDSQYR